MQVLTKATAEVRPAEDVDSPNGAFEVILSAPTLDRDGETLHADEWKQPLPDHITFDIDHGMSVASTVGSGKPFLDDDGKLRVTGSYASTDLAQQTRALVNEGHIRTTSVAFMTERASKSTKPTRELLNGSFVAVPANREALVLASKAAAIKEGRRNNASDAEVIQRMHDMTGSLGANCVKSVKQADPDEDPGALAQAIDATLDQMTELLADVDTTTLPEPVQQALALITAAEASVDELLDALGIEDPDDPEGDQPVTAAAAVRAAAAVSELDLKAARFRVLSAITSNR